MEDERTALEEGLLSLDQLCAVPALPGDAYARSRALLLQDAVSACVRLSRLCAGETGRQRRILALIRRGDVGCRLALSCLTEQIQPEEARLLHSFLSLEAAVSLACMLPDNALRQALEFLIPECQDEIYRLANCLPPSCDPCAILGGLAEIMPGRPLIACHRHPFDGLAETEDQPTDALSRAAAFLMEAICRELYEMHASSRAEDPLTRALHRECALIREEHVSLFSSLRPAGPPMSLLYLAASLSAWLFSSCAQAEEKEDVKALYGREAQHARVRAETLRAWADPEGEPLAQALPPFVFAPCKGAVRDAVRQAGLTLAGSRRVPVGALSRDADFFRYQRRAVPADPLVPSHAVIQRRIEAAGCDYRFEIAPHPIPALRGRQSDDTRIGR